MKRFTAISVLSLLMALPLVSWSQFRVSAELRPRFEMNMGAGSPLPDSLNTQYYVTQRTRLNFDFTREKYQLRLSLQDVRLWGDGDIYSATGVFGSNNGVDIKEAWFRLNIGRHSALKIGRQELKLDDQRLIAGRNWNQFGISYDALVYQFGKNDWDINLALSYNNLMNRNNGRTIYESDFFGNTNLIKTLNYLHIRKKFNKNLTASAMAIASGFRKTDNPGVIYITGTYGFRTKYTLKHFDLSGEIYLQNGKAQSGKDVSAYMLALHPGVKFGDFRLGIGGEYLSGDDARNDNYSEKERTFNTLYGAVYKFNGYMNYYSYKKSSTANGGLIDIYPNLAYRINEKHSLSAYYHFFSLAGPVLISNEVIDDKDLGSELDLVYVYRVMPELTVQAGFSRYFTSSTLEKVKKVSGSPIHTPYWAYVMLTFTPELFNTK
jgi:hypothetical protein